MEIHFNGSRLGFMQIFWRRPTRTALHVLETLEIGSSSGLSTSCFQGFYNPHKRMLQRPPPPPRPQLTLPYLRHKRSTPIPPSTNSSSPVSARTLRFRPSVQPQGLNTSCSSTPRSHFLVVNFLCFDCNFDLGVFVVVFLTTSSVSISISISVSVFSRLIPFILKTTAFSTSLMSSSARPDRSNGLLVDFWLLLLLLLLVGERLWSSRWRASRVWRRVAFSDARSRARSSGVGEGSSWTR